MASGHQAEADQGVQEFQEVTTTPGTVLATPLATPPASMTTRELLAENNKILKEAEQHSADLQKGVELQEELTKSIIGVLAPVDSVLGSLQELLPAFISRILECNGPVMRQLDKQAAQLLTELLGQFQETLTNTLSRFQKGNNLVLGSIERLAAQLLWVKQAQSMNTKMISNILNFNNSAFNELESENAQLRQNLSSLEERLQEVEWRLASHNRVHERQLQESGTRMQLLERLAQESLGSQTCQRRTQRLRQQLGQQSLAPQDRRDVVELWPQAVETCTEAPERFGQPGSQLHGSGSALKQRKQELDHCAEAQTSEQSAKRQRPEALEPEIRSP